MQHLTPNSRTTQLVAACVLGGITACGMYFNSRYAIQLGHSLDEKIVLGVASIAFDAAKVLAFCYLCHHLARLAIGKAALCALIWVLTASYGSYAAGSYAFSQLASAQLVQDLTNKELRARADKIARLEKDGEDAKLARNSKGVSIWASSGSCLTPTTPESSGFCDKYWLQQSALDKLRDEASKDKRIEKTAAPEIMEWSRLTGLSVHEVMVAIALIFALIMEAVASVSGFAFCKNARDVKDEIAAENRRRNHERRMAQIEAMKERNERRNERARERRAGHKPALHVVRA